MNFTDRAKTYNTESPWILNPEYIDPMIPEPYGNRNLLDVCSGTGVVAIAAKARGWNVLATDNNMDMLKLAEDTVCVEYSDIEDMPFDNNRFEVVTCRQGLQYTNIRRSISECLRVAVSQVRLLHAYVFDSDIPTWNGIISLMERTPRQFFSNDMLSAQIIDVSTGFSCEENLLRSSREILDFSIYQNRDAIIEFIKTADSFITNHNAKIDGYILSYDLKWVLHIITK